MRRIRSVLFGAGMVGMVAAGCAGPPDGSDPDGDDSTLPAARLPTPPSGLEGGLVNPLGGPSLEGSGPLAGHPFPGDGLVGLTSGHAGARNLAVDLESVYWIDTPPYTGVPTIWRENKAGGNPVALTGGTVRPYALAVADDGVYFTDLLSSAIYRSPKTGGVPERLADAKGDAVQIAVREDTVYWTNRDGTVWCASTDGGEAVALAADDTHPIGISADEGNLYWATQSGLVLSVAPGADARAIAGDEEFQAGPLADGTSLFWVSGGYVHRFTKATGDREVLADAGDQVNGIAIDRFSFYWTSDEGTVNRVLKTGGPVHVLADEQDGPGHLAVDTTGVYFTNLDDATVVVLPF